MKNRYKVHNSHIKSISYLLGCHQNTDFRTFVDFVDYFSKFSRTSLIGLKNILRTIPFFSPGF